MRCFDIIRCNVRISKPGIKTWLAFFMTLTSSSFCYKEGAAMPLSGLDGSSLVTVHHHGAKNVPVPNPEL